MLRNALNSSVTVLMRLSCIKRSERISASRRSGLAGSLRTLPYSSTSLSEDVDKYTLRNMHIISRIHCNSFQQHLHKATVIATAIRTQHKFSNISNFKIHRNCEQVSLFPSSTGHQYPVRKKTTKSLRPFLPRCIVCRAVFPMSVCPSVCQTREL